MPGILKKPLLFISALCFLVYANSLKAGFVGDDHLVVVNNQFIRSMSNVVRLFDKTYLTTDRVLEDSRQRDIGSGESSWRPLSTLTYMTDHWLWGEKPSGYHLTNLLLHLMAVFLVFVFVGRLSVPPGTAILTAAFFALHPVNASVVYSIGYREDSLAFVGVLAGLLLYRRPALSAICYFFAMASKESAVIMPLLAWAQESYFPPKRKENRNTWLYAYYAGALILFTALWAYFTQDISNAISLKPLIANGAGKYALTMVKVFGIYALWFTLPMYVHETCPEPTFFVGTFLAPAVYLSAIVWAGVASAAYLTRKKFPSASFALLWIIIALIPVSGLLPLRHVIAPRFLYIAGFGFCLFAAVLILRCPKRFVWLVGAVLIIYYSVFSSVRGLIYRNNLGFWSELAAYSPNNAAALSGLASEYWKRGAVEKAAALYERALRLSPDLKEAVDGLNRCRAVPAGP